VEPPPRRPAGARRRALATAVVVGMLFLPGGSGHGRPAPAPPPEAPVPGTGADAVRIRGGPELALLTRRALERLLDTRVGDRARTLLETQAREAAPPLTIELNLRGEHFTPYRVPGRTLGDTIVFDPWTLPTVETAGGPAPATRETVLAHELGHALFKLRSEAEVIDRVENPVRAELGLPLRARF